jgi:phosphoribosyl 1,2-cyclic phosphodiesterase
MQRSLTVQSLASGSSGNMLLIESDGTLVAVDCGLGPRGLLTGLARVGRTVSDLAAVLVTHEHSDHTSSLATVIAGDVPVVCTAGTARATDLPRAAWIGATCWEAIIVAGLEITPIPVSHDAAEPSGFRIAAAGGVVTVLTDIGQPDLRVCEALADADLVVLEANHDVELLRNGPYPAHLKRRVLSPTGHLSNADCADLLAESFGRQVKPRSVWLAHLSQTNNRPNLAVAAVAQRLAIANLAVPIAPLPRHVPGPVWSPTQSQPAATQLAMPGF